MESWPGWCDSVGRSIILYTKSRGATSAITDQAVEDTSISSFYSRDQAWQTRWHPVPWVEKASTAGNSFRGKKKRQEASASNMVSSLVASSFLPMPSPPHVGWHFRARRGATARRAVSGELAAHFPLS
uniref:Uncharacterized protein n=1 Tax=Pipistrellus kuhlii TaxID=59472 RepID=A0A7J7XV93_PIPKU|nr:hypothetical protein mPipKuh1_010473 [Pipistrellus kuhlii]